jgi:hypothetical protein
VGLTLAGLVVAVYYGIPMMRLAIWTAQNDFRESCKSDLEAGMPRTPACDKTLEQSAQPPPIRKRTIPVKVYRSAPTYLQHWGLVIFVALLVTVWKILEYLAHCRGEIEKLANTPVSSSMTLQDTAKEPITMADAPICEVASETMLRDKTVTPPVKGALETTYASHLRNEGSSMNDQSIQNIPNSTAASVRKAPQCAYHSNYQSDTGMVGAPPSEAANGFAQFHEHLNSLGDMIERNGYLIQALLDPKTTDPTSASLGATHHSLMMEDSSTCPIADKFATATEESTQTENDDRPPRHNVLDQKPVSACTTNEESSDEGVALNTASAASDRMMIQTQDENVSARVRGPVAPFLIMTSTSGSGNTQPVATNSDTSTDQATEDSESIPQHSTGPIISASLSPMGTFSDERKIRPQIFGIFTLVYNSLTACVSLTAQSFLSLRRRPTERTYRTKSTRRTSALITGYLAASIAVAMPYHATPCMILLAKSFVWNWVIEVWALDEYQLETPYTSKSLHRRGGSSPATILALSFLQLFIFVCLGLGLEINSLGRLAYRDGIWFASSAYSTVLAMVSSCH